MQPPYTLDHGLILRAILLAFSQPGKTIDEINGSADSSSGHTTQKPYKNQPVWWTKKQLTVFVADKLKIHPSMFGPKRISDELNRKMYIQIAKLKRKGLVTNWDANKHFSIWRLTKSLEQTRKDLRIESAAKPYTPKSYPMSDYNDANDLKQIFLSILTKGYKDNTYKFTLAKVLLDYCKKNRAGPIQTHQIPYQHIASKFLKYYWYQQYKFKMKQDFHTERQPAIITILKDVFGKNPPGDFALLDKKDIKKAENKILKAVFGHARRKTSLVIPKFQNVKAGNTVRSVPAFYDWDDDAQVLHLKPKAFEFFVNNGALLANSVLVEWAKFLEKANHSLPRLVSKIDKLDMKRGSLLKYQRLYRPYNKHCFYCRTKLETGYIDVDHFIPWSYIYEDKAWNLVLACQRCNCTKSNSLPKEDFLIELNNRNQKHYDEIKALRLSLDQLDSGKGWSHEIQNHYDNCKEYGFNIIHL